MTPPEPPVRAESKFRTTLTRVLMVQAVSLALLGLLQILYGRGG